MHRILILFSFVLLVACSSNTNTPGAATSDTATSGKTMTKATVKNISQEEFKMRHGKIGVFTLDVRTPAEINAGKVRGAIDIDFKSPDFKMNIDKLPRDKEYLVYCRSGGRSSDAAAMMVDMGFQNVSNLLGGFNDYKE